MTTRAVGAKKGKDRGRMNQLVMSQKENLIGFFRGLSLKHELVCQRLCGYLEANNKHDGSGNTIVPWQHRPHGEIQYYGDLKGLR
jgi:hypothetical protein